MALSAHIGYIMP